jgi:aminomethyltransferase
MAADNETLRRTPLHSLHVELGARLVPFAGYSMPVQYEGILAEHRWTREHAGLFDVSHMGQRFLIGPNHVTTASALQHLTPGDFVNLALGRMRYTMLLNDSGGIVDDLMVTRSSDDNDDGYLGLVFNAGRKEIDDDFFCARLPDGVTLHKADDRALLSLQGREAHVVLARHCPKAERLVFMARPAPSSTASTAPSRAPATPARTGSRSPSRRATPGVSRERCWPNRVRADRARRAHSLEAGGRTAALRP